MQFDAKALMEAAFLSVSPQEVFDLYTQEENFDVVIEKDDQTYAGTYQGNANGNDDAWVGTSGSDFFNYARRDSELFVGGEGNDYFESGSGDDQHFGGSGNDAFRGGSGYDLWDGNDGFDAFLQEFYELVEESLIVRNLETGYSGFKDSSVRSDQILNMEGVFDLLTTDLEIVGNSADNILITGEGDDTFFGGIGNDKIRGGEGTDTARYTNARSEYVVTTETGPEGQILYRVTSLDQSETSEGSDLLFSDIELLEFAGEVMTIEDALVPVSAVTEGQYSLTAIANVFGSIMFLDGLTETVTSTSHTIEYNGTIFDYAEVDGIITTVVRDGEFTSEFAAEIAESFPDSAGISYSTAVALIGQANMESTLLMVAGADGNYVG